jgi:hypothetical protein
LITPVKIYPVPFWPLPYLFVKSIAFSLVLRYKILLERYLRSFGAIEVFTGKIEER